MTSRVISQDEGGDAAAARGVLKSISARSLHPGEDKIEPGQPGTDLIECRSRCVIEPGKPGSAFGFDLIDKAGSQEKSTIFLAADKCQAAVREGLPQKADARQDGQKVPQPSQAHEQDEFRIGESSCFFHAPQFYQRRARIQRFPTRGDSRRVRAARFRFFCRQPGRSGVRGRNSREIRQNIDLLAEMPHSMSFGPNMDKEV